MNEPNENYIRNMKIAVGIDSEDTEQELPDKKDLDLIAKANSVTIDSLITMSNNTGDNTDNPVHNIYSMAIVSVRMDGTAVTCTRILDGPEVPANAPSAAASVLDCMIILSTLLEYIDKEDVEELKQMVDRTTANKKAEEMQNSVLVEERRAH